MLSEVDIDGIYVAPIVVYAAVSMPIAMFLRAVLWRIGVLRLVWHPALLVFALYISVLSLLVLLV